VVMGTTYRVGQRSQTLRVRKVALFVFAATTLIVPIGLIGGFEGAYNHVLKDVLFFAGLGTQQLATLFPPPRYEMPNDFLFEVTGVLQTIPAALAAYSLWKGIVRSSSSHP
jgi:hypothetical protein